MTEITGGKLFARSLQAEGIEFLFGLPSPESDPLLVELREHGIRLVPVRHEAAAVHMAAKGSTRPPAGWPLCSATPVLGRRICCPAC